MGDLERFYGALREVYQKLEHHLPKEVFQKAMEMLAWDKLHFATVSSIRGMAVAVNKLAVGDVETSLSTKIRMLADTIKEIYGKDAITFGEFLRAEFDMMTETRKRDLSLMRAGSTQIDEAVIRTTLLRDADALALAAIVLIAKESKQKAK